MAKNFAAIYASGNDAVALNQSIFIKEETTRGSLILPAATDFFFHLEGGSVDFSQPIESSPHKTGRHHTSIIKQKTTTEWSIPTFFNIDTTLGAASTAQIDPALRVLWKSLLGREVAGPPLAYDAVTDPSITFSIFENLDVMGKQAPGCAVDTANNSFPGDGQAQTEWAGMAKTAFYVGIGKSTISNNGGNTVTVQAGEGTRFPVGGKVMLVESDGTSRSTDTPSGSARTVTAVAGDVVTVDGAALTDADGSGTPIYLCYYEPGGAISAINNPQTGLQGSVAITGLPSAMCVRSASVNIANNHEWEDFCYGKEGLGDTIFTPAGRLTVEVSLELNLTKAMVGYLNGLRSFTGEDITIVLGAPAGRRVQMDIPKAVFSLPPVTVPGTGTIPVSFTGTAYQTSNGAADEILVRFL